MSLATLLNPDDPLYDFEHMMQHRQLFAVMPNLFEFDVLPYLLDPAINADRPASSWNKRHQQAHDDFNAVLPGNYNNGYAITHVVPIPPPIPPDPPYDQATAIGKETFGINQPGILLEGIGPLSEDRSWWTFVNHQQHFAANNSILPLPVTLSPVGTGPGTANLSNPWWWAQRRPILYPFW